MAEPQSHYGLRPPRIITYTETNQGVHQCIIFPIVHPLSRRVTTAIGVVLATLTLLLAAAALAPSPASAECADWRSAAAGFGGWVTSTGTCAVAGHPGFRESYTWATQPGTTTFICVQGRGISGGFKWYNLGCGTSGGGLVPWGNATAMTQVRAKVAPGFFGGLYKWR